MRIACITRHPYPAASEIRVTKFVASLAAGGHNCAVYCPGNEGDTTEDVFAHGRIRRLRTAGGAIRRLVLAPLPVNLAWAFWLTRRFRRDSTDLVIVRDLRLFLPAFVAARLNRLSIILDIGEHYPGMMKVVGKQRLAHFIIRNRLLTAWLEDWSVRLADAVFVVVEENRARLSRLNDQIDVIGNYPPAAAIRPDRYVEPRGYSTDGRPVTAISLGLIDSIRGLDLAIEAFALLKETLPNVHLAIHGDGPYRSALEARVAAAGIDACVSFGGWVAEDRKYDVLEEGDIGLILHKVCLLTQHTQPNKLFDYMSVGMPVLATSMAPVARILEEEHCGVVVEETPEAVAKGLQNLILDYEERRLMGENGRKAVMRSYLWDNEASKLLMRVAEFGPRRSHP